MSHEYAKVILYAYPHLRALAEASGAAAENQAYLSYRSRFGALETAERIAEEFAMRSRLLRLADAVDDMLRHCSREECFLLEYRYFRRRKRLAAFGDFVAPCSERTYFRRQEALLRRVAAMLAARGWTQAAYHAAFSVYEPFVRLLRALREGREQAVAAPRGRRGVTFAGRQNSCCSRGARFPRSKMTAMATAATQARTMTAICTPPTGAAASVSPETEAEGSSLRSKAGGASAGR